MTISSPEQSESSQSTLKQNSPELKGTWLFKDNGGVLGPVAPELILDRLQKLELSANVLFTRDIGQPWLPISGIPAFQETFNRAQQLKIQQDQELERKKKQTVLGIYHKLIWLVLIIIPVSFGLLAGHLFVKQDFFNETKAWIDQTPPLLAILAPPVETTQPKEKNNSKKKDLLAQKDAASSSKATSKSAVSNKGTTERHRKKTGKNKLDAKAQEHLRNKKAQKEQSTGKKEEFVKVEKKVAETKKKKVGLRSLSSKQIKAGLKKGSKGFRRCIMAAIKKENNDLPAVITIAFSVANNGKAVQTKLLERQVRKSPLEKCLQVVVGKLKWPEFYGERKYTEIPFRISKPKTD